MGLWNSFGSWHSDPRQWPSRVLPHVSRKCWHQELPGNVVRFRGWLWRRSQIKFSLKFQAGHGCPGEGNSKARRGQAGRGSSPEALGWTKGFLGLRLLPVLGDQRSADSGEPPQRVHSQSSPYMPFLKTLQIGVASAHLPAEKTEAQRGQVKEQLPQRGPETESEKRQEVETASEERGAQHEQNQGGKMALVLEGWLLEVWLQGSGEGTGGKDSDWRGGCW